MSAERRQNLPDEILRSRFEGALLGTMVGDVLGAPVEGWDCQRVNDMLDALPTMERPQRELNHAVFGLITGAALPTGAARYTDDTQMALGVAESLIAAPAFDGADMARRFADNFEGQRGYGPGAYGVMLALRQGAAWNEPAKRLFGGRGSFGNGAAMRAAPVGLLYADNLAELRRIADAQATITHTHALGRQGAVLQSAAVAAALLFDLQDDFEPNRFVDQVAETAGNLLPEFADALDKVRMLLEERPAPCEVAEVLDCGIEAQFSVPAALYSFVAHFDSCPQAVLFAVRLGGDADTIGAMCGAIAGALHGVEAVPANWLDALENGHQGRDYTRQLGSTLFDTWKKLIV